VTVLLMIPGPIELSPAVKEAASVAPPSHLAPAFLEAFGRSLEAMRAVWRAPEGAQPFVLAGSGTLAMEMAVANLLDPGQRALVVDTGYFSDRMARMLERRGVDARRVSAEPGETVPVEVVAASLARRPVDAVFVTHVDTSTGVRADAPGIAAVAREHGALVVVDGVCATAGEALDQAADGVDVYLTASQKAIGAPPGLALLVASPRALEARARLVVPPPMAIDFHEWIPIMAAYEARRPSYFATPATSLVLALDVALRELLADGMDEVFARHARVGAWMRDAWAKLGLELVPAPGAAANTLSAIRYPAGVDATLPARVAARGVAVAGGLHPKIKAEYFRVGHMGWVTTQPALLERTVQAVADALSSA
jgi:alanine-glyoxylate transaminase/serine-glyoxylate transaminase/serine-pyruvate transaminase